jgi:cation transport ATPase
MESLITAGPFSAYLYRTFNLVSGSIHLYYDTASMLVSLVLTPLIAVCAMLMSSLSVIGNTLLLMKKTK